MQNFAIKFIFQFLYFCCRFPVDKTLHILSLNLSKASTKAKKIKSFEIIWLEAVRVVFPEIKERSISL